MADDTDVYVILLSIAKEMKGTLYFRQGKSTVGKGIEYHNVSAKASFLGEHCCKIIPAFHALTGCDITYPFFGRFTAFSMMVNLKNAKNRKNTVHLLQSFGSDDIDDGAIINFILHTIYNRPLTEKTPKDSNVQPLDPVENGWELIEQELVPDWFPGASLPSDEEYDAHLKQKLLESVREELLESDTDSSDTSDFSDEYPESEIDM